VRIDLFQLLDPLALLDQPSFCFSPPGSSRTADRRDLPARVGAVLADHHERRRKIASRLTIIVNSERVLLERDRPKAQTRGSAVRNAIDRATYTVSVGPILVYQPGLGTHFSP